MKEQITEIASMQNKFFKKFKSLNIKKYREKEAQFLLEGQRYIDTALQNGFVFDAIIFDYDSWHNQIEESIKNYYSENSKVFIFSEPLFKELTQTEQSQGIIGVLPIPKRLSLKDSLNQKSTWNRQNVLVLDRIQDPGNLGTIIRTADAAGIDTIITVSGTVDPYNSKVVRSSAGSILHINLIEVENSINFINLLKEFGYKIIVTALEGAVDYNEDSSYGDKNCLIIGNEGNGVSKMLIESSDSRVKIPIVGRAESLNASVAAGIMMYKLQSR